MSVAAQTYPNIEHIVIDGGSTDQSVDLLRKANHNLVWHTEGDSGQSEALNKALRESRGKIIGWLNSDDAYFDIRTVSWAVRALLAAPDVALVYGHASLVDAEGVLLPLLWTPPHTYSLLRYHNYISQPTVFIRRDVLRDQLVDERYDYTMDRELWLRLGTSYRFRRVDHILAADRHHASRKSYTLLETASEDRARLRREYGVPLGPAVNVFRRGVGAFSRFAGARLVSECRRSLLAFPATIDSTRKLAVRQLLMTRARMAPLDLEPPRTRTSE